jgi:(3R)-3-hydroxyacyl-CoA dehydrogenase / 3a,7a,12a-trihydroxy-5b-cholest-24-enoyl-CoA hydratase / enoyl-CoA hydratase 2
MRAQANYNICLILLWNNNAKGIIFMPPTLAQVQAAIGMALPPLTYAFTERDTALYALGVGAPASAVNPDELKFVYELHQQGFVALPTMATVYVNGMIHQLVSGRLGEIEYNPMMLVHGEQSITLPRPLPTQGTITCQPRIHNIYDKGSGMLVVTDVTCVDQSGQTVAETRASMFIRGIGGYGGERGSTPDTPPPDRAPDAEIVERTQPNQALLYRLMGDMNPLHADPMMAALGNFERPILHGLCTYGYAGRAVLRAACGNNPARLHSMSARFSKHVFPGETLVTQVWHTDPQHVHFLTRVQERDVVVLSNGVVILRDG